MAKADKKGVGALARSPTHLLHTALQLALDIYGDEVGAAGLTQRQYAVLVAVSADEGLTQTELVSATGIDRSTLADMIARMVEKGLLDRAQSSRDARAKTVRLTETGRDAFMAAEPRVTNADARILSYLTPGKRDAFIAALCALSRAGEATLVGDAAVPKKQKKADKKLAKADKPPKLGKSDKKKKKKARKDRSAEPPPEVG